MRHEHERQPEIARQAGEQLQDLRLHHDVEGRRRLVGEENLRVARERHRDRGALAHAARELMRVPVGAVGRDPHRLEELAGPLPAAAPSATSCSRIGSMIWAPTVFTGLNAFMAPWKTIAMSRHRCSATLSSPRSGC